MTMSPGVSDDVTMPYQRTNADGPLILQYAYRAPSEPQKTGGDFVLARRYRDGSISVLVTDLWAKAAEAAHYACRIQEAFERLSRTPVPPGELLHRLDAAFSAELRVQAASEGTATAFAIACDARGELLYASAGTDCGLLFRGIEPRLHLESTGPLLGLDASARYAEKSVRLEPGDLLVVCTDGVTEARGPHTGRVQLGTRGLSEMMQSLLVGKQAPTCDDLLQRVDAWTGGTLHDDATAVFLSGRTCDSASEPNRLRAAARSVRHPIRLTTHARFLA
jgi:sigma-B regulation protein RsbU (phosphoserine phosphatase)